METGIRGNPPRYHPETIKSGANYIYMEEALMIYMEKRSPGSGLPPALFDRSQGIFTLHAFTDSHAQRWPFLAVGCHFRKSEKSAIANLASTGIEPTPITAAIVQRPSSYPLGHPAP